MTETEPANTSGQVAINNNTKMLPILLAILGALGAGTGGSFMATSGIEDTIDTRLVTLETKMDGWQSRVSAEIEDVKEDIDSVEKSVEKIKEDIHKDEQESKVNEMYLQLLEKMNEMKSSLSDRLAKMEAEMAVIKSSKRSQPKD